MNNEHKYPKTWKGVWMLAASASWAVTNHILLGMAAKGGLGIGPCGLLMLFGFGALLGVFCAVTRFLGACEMGVPVVLISTLIWMWLVVANFVSAAECSAAC